MSVVPDAIETPQQAARRLAAGALRDGYQPYALHVYRDADGAPVYWRIRMVHPDTGDKWIRPMHWIGTGYVLGEPPAPPSGKPLYGLDRLAAEPDAGVYVVEGEGCADALSRLGLIAVTSGGATSADAADWSPLRGRACIIWPDHDTPGMAYAVDAAGRLRALSCTVELIAPDVVRALPEHGDVVDWLAQHPDATAEDVRALATVQPTHDPGEHRASDYVDLIDAASLTPEPIRWLWPGWLARGKLHVMAGAPGTGKTTIAVDLAACISAGRPLPSGWRPDVGRVLIWSGEDDPVDTIVPRLLAAGADLSRVQIVGDVHEDGRRYPFDPARDVDKLAAAARSGNVALLIIDPLVSAVSGDSHKNAEVRRGLAPLVDLAARMDAALLGITHFTKGTSGREPLERVTGSLAFGALARVVLGTVRTDSDDADDRRMILARCKSNIGPDGGGFSYAFEQTELLEHGGLVANRIAWGEAVEGTARELLGAEIVADSPRDDAIQWLSGMLGIGSVPVKAVRAEASAAGVSWRTIERAKAELGVIAERVSSGNVGGGHWEWRLPDSAMSKAASPTTKCGGLAESTAQQGFKAPQEAQGRQSQSGGVAGGLADSAEVFEL